MTDDNRDAETGEEDIDLDGLEDDRTVQIKSPVSGIDSATGAGTSLEFTARSLFARRTHRWVKSELPAYLLIQCSWYMAFGLQMVLFPYLITNRLGLDGTELGLANMALSGPSVIFLLLGGVIAERSRSKPLLMILHFAAALPAAGLAFADDPPRLARGGPRRAASHRRGTRDQQSPPPHGGLCSGTAG